MTDKKKTSVATRNPFLDAARKNFASPPPAAQPLAKTTTAKQPAISIPTNTLTPRHEHQLAHGSHPQMEKQEDKPILTPLHFAFVIDLTQSRTHTAAAMNNEVRLAIQKIEQHTGQEVLLTIVSFKGNSIVEKIGPNRAEQVFSTFYGDVEGGATQYARSLTSASTELPHGAYVVLIGDHYDGDEGWHQSNVRTCNAIGRSIGSNHFVAAIDENDQGYFRYFQELATAANGVALKLGAQSLADFLIAYLGMAAMEQQMATPANPVAQAATERLASSVQTSFSNLPDGVRERLKAMHQKAGTKLLAHHK